MHYLVDGYNLAHWLAGERDCGPEELRDLLMAALARTRPRDASEITVYWDARGADQRAPSNEYGGGVAQRYVPVADEAIVDAVAASRQPHRLVVVSRDREVTGRSRQLGARSATPEDLLGDGRRPRGGNARRRRGRRPGGR